MDNHTLPARPRFFVGRSDRLIARLKEMLWAWRFAQQANGQLVYFWVPLPERVGEERKNYKPGHILDLPKFYAGGGGDHLLFLEDLINFPHDAIDLGGQEFEHCRAEGFDRARFTDTSDVFLYRAKKSERFAGFRMDDEPEQGYMRLREVRKLFASLPPNPIIERVLNTFFERNEISDGKFAAIHVRRGDCYDQLRQELLDEDVDRTKLFITHLMIRTAPLEFYRPFIEKLIQDDIKIVFTSDTPDVIEEFRNEFGRKHFIDLSNVVMKIPIQKAFLDFLILTKARTIVGTGSNFGQFASQLSGRISINVALTGEVKGLEDEFFKHVVAGHDIKREMVNMAIDTLRKKYERRDPKIRKF